MNSKSYRSALLIFALLLAGWSEAQAQWIQQTVQLRPGWNAVFLEVAPTPEDCDTLFAGLPVESAWDFNRNGDSPQFIQDPATLVPGTTGWLTWYPPGHALSGAGNLFTLRDGRAYLIKMADNAQPVTWTVSGRPSLRRTVWQAGAANLVGFHVAAQGPTFQSLFAGEPGLVGQAVFTLDATGVWRPVVNVSTTRPKAGEAYWIRCKSPSQRTGTILVDTASRLGLDFGADSSEQSLRIRNSSASARNLTVRVIPTGSVPPGQAAPAGPVPLEYYRANYAASSFDWQPITSPLTYPSLASGAEWNVRLGVRRSALPGGANAARCESIVEVVDDLGTRWLIPVSAQSGAAAPGAGFQASSSPSGLAGLWIGDAIIDQISQPAHPANPATPRRAGGVFSFRLIAHVDATGTTRLLQHVFLVGKPTTFVPNPEDPEVNIVEAPPRTLVVTDEALIPSLIGNGEITGRRVSSAAFSFEQPIELSGGLFGDGIVGCAIPLGYNDRLNPFKHLFHPDHNNLDERYEQALGEGKEAFSVTRNVSLEFSGTDVLGVTSPGWGESEVGGVYRETIAGLHRSPINIRGTFRLARASRAASLNQ